MILINIIECIQALFCCCFHPKVEKIIKSHPLHMSRTSYDSLFELSNYHTL